MYLTYVTKNRIPALTDDFKNAVNYGYPILNESTQSKMLLENRSIVIQKRFNFGSLKPF